MRFRTAGPLASLRRSLATATSSPATQPAPPPPLPSAAPPVASTSTSPASSESFEAVIENATAEARADTKKGTAATRNFALFPWNPTSIRTGLLAKKVGMTAIWDQDGVKQPCTVLHVDSNVVTTIIRKGRGSPSALGVRRHPWLAHREPYTGLRIAAGFRKLKNVHPAQRTELKNAGVASNEGKMKMVQFRVSPDAVVDIGTELSVSHFVPGQYIDVQGTTIGKGFQGGMKRHGFKGMPASHGVSVVHRSIGSTGMRTDPARVFPGKKMPGNMGNRNATMPNLRLLKIDTEAQVLYVKGSVAGHPGSWVRVTDAVKATRYLAQERIKRGWDVVKKEQVPTGGGKGGASAAAKAKSAAAAQLEEEGPVEREILEGVKTLPYPAGTKEMDEVLSIPREILAVNKRRKH